MPRGKSPWPERDAELKAWKATGKGLAAIAKEMGMTPGQIAGRTLKLNLHFMAGIGAPLRADHPALAEGHTIFPSAVRDAKTAYRLLKEGSDSYKLGARVEKGPWRGMPIFSLTLEERATCPRSCAVWRWCYGNTSPLRIRFKPGFDLELRLEQELMALNKIHPGGFVVRLHMLGDFYSADYVRQWHRWMFRFGALHIFGYTAWPANSAIGKAVSALNEAPHHRVLIRFSSRSPGPCRTITIKDADEAGLRPRVIVCPAQTGATRSCGTCGLCWAPSALDKTIAFIRHGINRKNSGRKKNGSHAT